MAMREEEVPLPKGTPGAFLQPWFVFVCFGDNINLWKWKPWICFLILTWGKKWWNRDCLGCSGKCYGKLVYHLRDYAKRARFALGMVRQNTEILKIY